MQYFRPPLFTFNRQTACNSQTFCTFAAGFPEQKNGGGGLSHDFPEQENDGGGPGHGDPKNGME
jgi:hypothetical protein